MKVAMTNIDFRGIGMGIGISFIVSTIALCAQSNRASGFGALLAGYQVIVSFLAFGTAAFSLAALVLLAPKRMEVGARTLGWLLLAGAAVLLWRMDHYTLLEQALAQGR